jgi:hypothetical protein
MASPGGRLKSGRAQPDSASRGRRQPRAPGQPDYGALEAVKQAMVRNEPFIWVKLMPSGDYQVQPLKPSGAPQEAA